MTRQQALQDISVALARLRHQIGLENAAGYLSQNKLLENLLLPVFRVTLGAPDLRNANDLTTNVAHVDLVADQSKLALQITTTRSAAKITTTLTGFLNAKSHRRYTRLIFFVFASKSSKYQSSTAKSWVKMCRGKLRFDPVNDVIQFEDLFRTISNLNHAEIVQIRNIIAQSVVGEEYVDVSAMVTGQAQLQVNDEKNSGKYIPDIFVENGPAKSLARLFWHPVLFFEHILDDCDRSRLPFLNRLLVRCGLDELVVLERKNYLHDGTLAGQEAAAKKLRADLKLIESKLSILEKVQFRKPPPLPAKQERRHYYDQNTINISNAARSGKYWIEDILKQLDVLNSKVFILTGKAGQGKTNLVCDFVENFALKHGICCLYFTGLQLGRVSVDLPEYIRAIQFKGKMPTFEDVAKALSNHASSEQKPFVFLIEGLNEHTRLSVFAGQLEELIKTAIRYPFIRFFLSCRSEYFEQRFGNLQQSVFKADIFLLEAAEQRMDETQRDRMLLGYFKFFEIDNALVSEQAKETLRADTLLLRFFCEAYGKQGKPAGYVMPLIEHIYRAQIFDHYLKIKLRSAADARERLASSPSIRGTQADLMDVVKLIIGHMVEQRKFSDVPLSAVPFEKHADLQSLLGEDIILRRDPSIGLADLGPTRDVLNFTYDEFRDFLIAKYLIDTVYLMSGQQAFVAFLATGTNGATQITEGIKRFLFYWSRLPANTDFWRFYSTLPSYSEVYPVEIFSIDQVQLNADDSERVKAVLEAADDVATRTAHRLIRRWNAQLYPVLNLELLLHVAGKGDDNLYECLISRVFIRHYGMNRESKVESFCESFERNVLPQINSDVHQVLFDFLPLLFPIESNPMLESPAVGAFRRFATVAPKLCANALIRSLEFSFTKHRPFTWRLLTEFHAALPDISAVRKLALAELTGSQQLAAVEINRFLTKVPDPV